MSFSTSDKTLHGSIIYRYSEFGIANNKDSEEGPEVMVTHVRLGKTEKHFKFCS